MTVVSPLTLLGRELPFALTTVTCREYELQEQAVDAGAARSMLEGELLSRLDEALEETHGEVLRTDFISREEDGLFIVTMLAECREQIGVTVERGGKTGHVYDGPAPE